MSAIRKGTFDFLSSANPLDEYELIQRIGSGTYGDVYKARHIPTASIRALKVIKIEPGDDFNIVQQEILMMIQCDHPNIIAYFGSYLKRDKLWIAMELCSGGSMQDIYQTHGSLNEFQIAYVLKETLKGLDYLHRNGKMHRDIKGANILLTDDGKVKLADFGVAASITATIGKRKSFIGTPYWMAPEVAAVERKGGYDHLCDIWAVGITGIEFAELQPPMFDLHPMRALFLMSKSSFKPPTLKDKNKWSVTFHNFVKYALTKNPKKRPSAERLLDHPFFQGNLTSHIARDLLDRLHNGTTNQSTTGDRDDDDDDDDRSIFHALKKIASSQEPAAISSSNVRPLVANLNQTPLIRSSVLIDSNNTSSASLTTTDDDNRNAEDLQRLQSLGFSDEDIQRLTVKLPLKAFQNLTLDEIRHIVDVMRDADDEENDESNGSSTIKRAPKSASETSKKIEEEEQQQPVIDDNDTDTNNNTLKRTTSDSETNESNGIPSVPQVHMGAGFMKIFNQCPLEIHASYCWMNNDTKEQFVLIAAEEGIYSLNLNEIHDATLELLDARRATWLFVKDNILWSISGKSNSLYRHDLLLMMQHKAATRLSLPMNRSQLHQRFEKLMPKKSAMSVKINDTRGCIRCCVGRSHFNGFIYLAGLLPTEIFLMQYYDPMRKFMHLKTVSMSIPFEPRIFELIFAPDNPYTYVCFGVGKSKSSPNSFKFASVNFETELIENYSNVALIPNVSHVIQHENDADTVLICQGNHITVVDAYGKPRTGGQTVTDLDFYCEIRSLVCLQDSVLAFHEHGMQGRSLRANEITQEVYDETRVFRVIGRDRMVVLQSRPLNLSQSSTPSDLHILMGHENI